MYKNMFSNFFKFPIIGHLTHPPTSKVFWDFLNFYLFTWPLRPTIINPLNDMIVEGARTDASTTTLRHNVPSYLKHERGPVLARV